MAARQTRSIGKKEKDVAIGGRGGEVGGREGASFLTGVGICADCLNLSLKSSNLIFLLLWINWHVLDRP